MSLNSDEIKGVTGAHGSAQLGPRLQASGVGYSTWRPHMDVFLQRSGADGIHRKVMTEEMYMDLSGRVESWQDDALTAAMAMVIGNSSSSSSSSSATPTVKVDPLNNDIKESRRIVTLTVEKSRRVFGILYSALPDELRPQVEHIAQGWAYGL